MTRIHIDRSPHARAAMEPGDFDLICAECIAAGIDGVTLSGERATGPFTARISGGYRAQAWTPLLVFQRAVDMRRRAMEYGELAGEF